MTNRLWQSSDGTLYRVDPDNTLHELRPRYSWHYSAIETTAELRATLRAGPYAWPGGYVLELVTHDGATLCFECARAEYRSISASIRHKLSISGWRIIGCQVSECRECDHCGRPIGGADV